MFLSSKWSGRKSKSKIVLHDSRGLLPREQDGQGLGEPQFHLLSEPSVEIPGLAEERLGSGKWEDKDRCNEPQVTTGICPADTPEQANDHLRTL